MNAEPVEYKDFVKLVIEALEATGANYLIGGAMASWAWGDARTTLDLDLVIDIPLELVVTLSKELDKRDMLVPAEVILDNIIEARGDLPINAIHMPTGFKADIYPLRPKDELRREALSRRVLVDYGPPLGNIFVHSPEDLVIYKTLYYSISHQSKHARDVRGILKSVGEEMNFEYIDPWIERLNLQSAWAELKGA